MKQKHNGGFTLIEVMVAIAILGIVVVPILSGLETSLRLNKRTEALLQAQLTVSSAVEQLMAEGITEELMKDVPATDPDENYGWKIVPDYGLIDFYPDVKVKTEEITETYKDGTTKVIAYRVFVEDKDDLVSVTTTIRAAKEGDA